MKIFLIIILSYFSICCFAQSYNENIRINQIGYFTKAKKIAVITGEIAATDFYICSGNLSDTVYKGKLGPSIGSKHSSTVGRIADFSALSKKGSYVLLVPDLGHSQTFLIHHNTFSEAAKASLKAFYYQRVSSPLEETFAGKWHRSKGHPDTSVMIHPSAASAKRSAGTIVSSPGGWYDAGDYNKYVVNSGITTATLLSAYEDQQDYFKRLKLNIPESKNTLPDILDEVMINLRWMMTMQDPADGGVYHKCTNAKFDGMLMPGITKETRYLVQKSTAATLNFSAVMAQASRVFRNFKKELPGWSDSCMMAAKRAWTWAEQHPDMIYDQAKVNKEFEPDILTGAYGDGKLKDEFFWSASELYLTTRSDKYLTAILSNKPQDWTLPTWKNAELLGVYSLMKANSTPGTALRSLQDELKKIIMSMADNYVAYANQSAFHVPMGMQASDFVWGSNSNAANQSILLLKAYVLTKEVKYLDAAIDNADYMLGRNATGYCFLTGFGGKSPMHPHHRQSVADGIIEPVPGFLVGGPNPGRQDKCNYAYTETETSYTDDDCSYASNEIAINWNAPAAYVLNVIQAIQSVLFSPTKVGGK